MPRLPWQKTARKIMGKDYELDLIWATSRFMKKMNRRYRNLNKNANVLAFALTPRSGEIILDPKTAKKEYGLFGENFKKHLWRLFLHALLHLKGYRHERGGREKAKMERAEKKLWRGKS